MKILIVDDHNIVRAGIKQLLLEENPDWEFGETGSAVEAVKLVESRNWDIVLLDINLPKKNGIEVLKQIKQLKKSPPVLILSMYPEDQYAIRALRAGASGYMTKESAPEKLKEAVVHVADGRRYVTPTLAEQLAGSLNQPAAEMPHSCLSDREFDILLKIASGKNLSEIAAEMVISAKTVSTHRARILKKMKMKHNAELTHYAIRHKLID